MKTDKNSLRKRIARTPIAHPARQSSQVVALVERLPEFGQAQVVALYWPLRGEVDTRALIERWAGHKRIVLPVVAGDSLEWRQYDGRMAPGALGVPEPAGTAAVEHDRIDLVIVPGVAFTRDGARLGRGKGFYDRALSRMRACKVGICFAEQLVEELPLEAHDIGMDKIIAPTIKLSSNTL